MNQRRRPSRERRKERTPPEIDSVETAAQLRLNRYIARAGVCSRRKADTLIRDGRVRVNGEVVTDFSYRVDPDDTVEVNGKLISPRREVYFLLNKPKDTITTVEDDRDRRTVLDVLGLPEDERSGLFPVGRLDRDTVGVLLLTNDGELAHRLMHPRYEVEKLYVVRTKESVKPHELERLREGITLDDGTARADQAAYVDPSNHHVVGLMLHEGRNRQVRRMFEVLGHEVVDLERIRYAGLTSEGVRRGKWRRLHPHEIRRLRALVHLR